MPNEHEHSSRPAMAAINEEAIDEEGVRHALTQWAEGTGAPGALANLLLWQQIFVRTDVSSPLEATGALLRTAIAALESGRPEAARILTLRFGENEPGHRIAAMLHMAEGTVWRKQREAIAGLTAYLNGQENALRRARQARFAGRLNAPGPTHLIGVAHHVNIVREQLLLPNAPWLISLTGMGGIGKTSLADALMRAMLNHPRWHDFAWVTARQEVFNSGGAIRPVMRPALTTEALLDGLAQQLLSDDLDVNLLTLEQKRALLQDRLRARPHLIVIDNLETLLDIESLLETARGLANPTKFLFTSRNNRIYEPDLFLYAVTELNADDALQLVRAEAALRNLPAVVQATDAELMPIFDTVGGNPLALRLIVGQLHVHPLPKVLDDLHAARGHHATEVYAFVYYRIWQELDETARRVLLLMPLVTEQGGDIDYLTAVGAAGGLTPTDVSDGLERLVARSLVDSRGDLYARRFTIHTLTRTFLEQQVLRWGASDEGARGRIESSGE